MSDEHLTDWGRAVRDLARELRAERDRLLTPLVAWLSRRLDRRKP